MVVCWRFAEAGAISVETRIVLWTEWTVLSNSKWFHFQAMIILGKEWAPVLFGIKLFKVCSSNLEILFLVLGI